MAEGHSARGLHGDPKLGRLHPSLPRPGLHYGEPEQAQVDAQAASVKRTSEEVRVQCYNVPI